MKRVAFALGIIAGVSLVVWGAPAKPLAPFWPELVKCYKRTAPESSVKEVLPYLPRIRSDQNDIDMAQKRIAPHIATAMEALAVCPQGSCPADAAARLIDGVRPYFVWRQRLTTGLFERRGEAAANITPLIFSSDDEATLKVGLKALVDSKAINLAAFRHERWIAALFVVKSDHDIRPCEYNGP